MKMRYIFIAVTFICALSILFAVNLAAKVERAEYEVRNLRAELMRTRNLLAQSEAELRLNNFVVVDLENQVTRLKGKVVVKLIEVERIKEVPYPVYVSVPAYDVQRLHRYPWAWR